MTSQNPYAVAENIDGGDQFPAKWIAAAAAFRDRAHVRMTTLSYGESDRQTMDLFWPEGQPGCLCVFVHGGFWRITNRDVWSHLASGMVARGWLVAVPGYDLCPQVRVSQITRQIARAVDVAAAQAAGPIVLTGHSAGGHLVARMLEPGMLRPSVRDRVKRVVPISPLADLEPLLTTPYNAELQLDLEEARAESPVNMPAPDGTDVEVWVGADETPVFLDQADWLARAWNVQLTRVEGRHHFDVIDALIDSESALVQLLSGAA